MGFKVYVNTYGDPEGSWATNAIVHESEEAAVAAAKDLFMRWTAVEWWRVAEEGDNGRVVASNKPEEVEA